MHDSWAVRTVKLQLETMLLYTSLLFAEIQSLACVRPVINKRNLSAHGIFAQIVFNINTSTFTLQTPMVPR